jgi:hypothetical protein
VIFATGFVTFSILYLPLMGFQGYLPSLLVMMLTVLFGSALGVLLAGFYKSAMSAIGWVFIFLMVLTLPTISLLNPVFSPGWLKFVPTYFTLFGLDAAMFPNQNAHIVLQSVIVLGGLSAALVLFSGWVFTRRIRKEA